MKLLIIISLLFTLTLSLKAEYIKLEYGKVYVFKLKNGDLITGLVSKEAQDEKFGNGISVETQLGEAVIFYDQIVECRLEEEQYRHAHRVFLMPTAVPIGDNHFIGDFELLFIYGGIGIMDKISVTAGRSIIPTIASDEQITELNVKFSVLEEKYENFDGKLNLAIGGNLALINDNNRFIHAYGVATFQKKRSRLSAALFFKLGSEDTYRPHFKNNFFDINHPNGAVGLALGLDTKFTHWHGLHFIGELWNANITKPQNTGVLLGFRLANTEFSADFGLAFFTAPIVAPFFSFVWTPF